MVEVLMTIPPEGHERHIGGLHPQSQFGGTSHIAVGIWLGTIAVLLIPSLGREAHQVKERHVLKAYNIVMTSFGLL
jgi:hypothetical protein